MEALCPSHGFLILDKPEGISSAKAVAQIKKLLGCKKIGHGGTLDPLASGVLPLAVGEATKAFDYVANATKQYRFTVTFGEERDTDDAEGKVTATTGILPTREQIEKALPEFIGTISQIPPAYSALKIDGERAYKKARAGEAVEMKARPVEVYSLLLSSCETPQAAAQDLLRSRAHDFCEAKIAPRDDVIEKATLHLTCGKGTYVRSLARDIARKCNSLGYVSVLRRTAVGKFTEAKAISLDKLPSLMHNAALSEAWLPIELALDDILAIDVDAGQAARLRHGQTFEVNKPDGRYMALHQGRIVALVEVSRQTLKPLRGFNLD